MTTQTGTTCTLEITGMACESCARHVEGALRAVVGVRNARVDLDAAIAVVEVEGGRVAVESLTEAVEESGYGARARGGGGA